MFKHLLTLTLIFVFCAAQAAEPLRFGIASTPSSGGEADTVYKDLNDYLAEKLGHDIVTVKKQNSETLSSMIKNGEIDFAAAGTFEVTDAGRSALRMVAIPVVHGRMSYRSYIIANTRFNITSIKGLKGHTFAFTDRMTGSGAIYPVYLMLKTFKAQPQRILGKIYYTQSNERTVYLVNMGVVEAAAVDGMVFNRIRKRTPKETEHIAVIHKSPEMIAPPFVASARLNPNTLRRLKNILLNMHNDPEGRIVLREMKIDRYEPAGRKTYQTLTDIQNTVDSFGHSAIQP